MKFYDRLIKILLVTLFILFPFGQLTKIPLRIPSVSLYLQDLIIALIVFSWIVHHFLKKKKFLKPPLFPQIAFFAFVAFLSLVINASRLSLNELFISSLYLLRWVVFAGIYFVVFELVFKNTARKRYNLAKGLVFAGTLLAIFGLLQYFLYPNLRNLYYLGWDPHYFRVFSLFFDPNFVGIILVLNLILILNLFWNRRKNSKTLQMKSSKHTKFSTSPHRENPFGPLSVCLGIWKFLIKLSVSSFGLAIAGILSYIALALTYSRSSYLAFIVGIGTTFLFRRSFKFFIIILLVLSLTLTVLPRPSGEGVKLERKASTIARLSSWNKALKIIKDHPIFGVGFNAYRYAQRDYGFLEKRKWQEAHAGGGADSSLLFVAATTGIVGFFAYLWLWGEITILSFKLSVVQKPWGVISLASILALLIHSLFLNSLFYPWVMIWVWVLLALPV